MNPRFIRLSLAAIFLACSATAHAAAYYWDNNSTTAGFGTASGTWGTDAYWNTSNTGGAGTFGSSTTTSDTLNFGAGTANNGLAAGTITLNGIVNASTLTFGSQSGAIVLSGGTALNLGATSTITVNNASDTISTPITGAATKLTKAGTGTLNLGSSLNMPNFYITGGKVVMGSGTTLTVGSGSSHAVDATTGQLDLSAATSFAVNVGMAMFGHNSGTSTITLGDSTITASTGFGVGMGGNFTGAAQNNGIGTVNINADSTVTINTPIFQIGVEKANNGTFKMLGTGDFTLEGISGGRTTVYVGSRIDIAINTSTTQGNVDLVSGKATLHLDKLYVGCNTGNATTANPTTGTMSLGNNSENHLDISGTGNVVQIGGAYNRGTPTGTLTIGNLDAASSITSTTDGSAAILIANRPNGADSANGTLNLNGGTLAITTTGASTSAIAGGGGTSTLVLGNATGIGSGMKLIAGASSTAWIKDLTSAKIKTTGVTFDTNGYDITVGQALLTDTTDTGGGLTKAGSGTLTLSNTNTYTGTTTVGAGTMALVGTGSIAQSAKILAGNTVASTAVLDVSGVTGGFTLGGTQTLGGTGTIAGAVTISASGILSPGASIESLIMDAVSMGDGSVFEYEVNAGLGSAVAADLLTVKGNLNLGGAGGTVTLDLKDLGSTSFAENTTLSLIQYTGTLEGGFFEGLADGAEVALAGDTWTIHYGADNGGLNFAGDSIVGSHFITLTNFSAVPEPGSFLALGCLIGSGMMLRRRRCSGAL